MASQNPQFVLRSTPFQDVVHPISQFEQIKRLEDVIVCPHFHSFNRRFHGSVSCNNEKSCFLIDIANGFEQVQAVDARHLQVGYHQIRVLQDLKVLECYFPILKAHHFVTDLLQGP